MTFDKHGICDLKPGKESKFWHKDYPKRRPFNKSAYLKEWDRYLSEPVKVVLDVGALDGGDTLRFNSWYPDAKIYSIEGSPHNFRVIGQKLEERKNVTVYNYVISDKDEEVEFHQVSYDAKRDSYYDARTMVMGSIYKMTRAHTKPHQLRPIDSVMVQSFTIDTFCEMHNITDVDIMHVDIEGAGVPMLKGMNTIRPKMIYIEKEQDHIFEDKPAGGTDALREILVNMGYTLEINLRNDYLFVRGI